jgi:trk system potassium uptake protein TrkH
MFLAGTNFVLGYFAFKGKVQKAIKDEEFKLYFKFIVAFTVIATIIIYFRADVSQSTVSHPMVWGEFESAFRHGMFQVLAIVTTTGFVSADYTAWTPFLTVFFFGLMFLGGSAGSTAGGVKVVRHLLLIKNGFLEFNRSLHPNAILPVRYNGKSVPKDIVFNILAFFILYMLLFIIGGLVFSMFQMDFQSAISLSASSLGNVGPALGKWWASFMMLLGRLELFTILILLTPFFWRKH